MCAVCALDSDSDGFTNGDELGDPCCRWRGGSADRSAEQHISHPNFASSKPVFASCSLVPSVANVSLVGIFLRPATSAGAMQPAAAVVSLPPAGGRDAQCVCNLGVSVNESVFADGSVSQTAFTRRNLTVPLLVSSRFQLGSRVTISLNLHTLAASSSNINFTAIVQPWSSLPVEALHLAAAEAGASFPPGSAQVKTSATSVNQPILLPIGAVFLITVLSVAILYNMPFSMTGVFTFCFNVRPCERRVASAVPCCQMTSHGFKLWQVCCAVFALISLVASARAYGTMFYVNMGQAVLGRALGSTSLALLFGSIASASHHLVLHWAGVSYDRSVFGHKLLGTTAVVMMVVHGVWMALSATIGGVTVAPSIDPGSNGGAWATGHWCSVCAVNPLAGTLAAVSAVLLLLAPSRTCIRQQSYSLFYVLHIAGSVSVAGFTFLHLRHSGVELNFTIVFPLVVLLVERIVLVLSQGALASGTVQSAVVLEGKAPEKPNAAESSPRLVHLTVAHGCQAPCPAPGQWLSLLIPGVSLMHHPVSVAAVTMDGQQRLLHFIVRGISSSAKSSDRFVDRVIRLATPVQSWSAKLVSLATEGTLLGSKVLLFDLPSGRATQPRYALARSREHVFLAGGVGITAVLSSAAAEACRGHVSTLVWCVREISLATEALELLRHLVDEYSSARSSGPQKAASASVAAVDGFQDNTLAQAGQAGASVPSVHPGAALHVILYVSSALEQAGEETADQAALDGGAAVNMFETENPVQGKVGAGGKKQRPVRSSKIAAALGRLRSACAAHGIIFTASAPAQRPNLSQTLAACKARASLREENSVCCYVCGPKQMSDAAALAVTEVNEKSISPRPPDEPRKPAKAGVSVLLHIEQFGW